MIDELCRSLSDRFEGWLFEDGIKTPVNLHYQALSKLDIQGLLEELPPYLRIDWHEGTFYSNDGKSYYKIDGREFDFYKLLDPRFMLNDKTLEVTRIVDNSRTKSRLLLARYNIQSMDLPYDLIEWFKKNNQMVRPVVFVIDDRAIIRLMSQLDLPPSPAIMSLFFRFEREEIDSIQICSSLLLATSAIREWRIST
jgi:hypothetical protein